MIDGSIWEFLKLSELFIDHGLPPVDGGVLDQAASFINYSHQAAAERSYWKRKQEQF